MKKQFKWIILLIFIIGQLLPSNITYADFDLETAVVKCYPDGKMKAAMLSFDDNAESHDRIMVNILRKHKLRGTFNVIANNPQSNGLSQYQKDNMKAIYKDMEVASHSYTHPTLSLDNIAGYTDEVTLSKQLLESVMGAPVNGFANPNSFVGNDQTTQILKDLGYHYARVATCNGKFDIPTNFYQFTPTMVHSTYDPNNPIYSLMYVTRKFIETNPGGKMQQFSILGHSWQFGASQNINDNTQNWNLLEDYSQAIEDNLDTIWNPTFIEFVDYINASNQLAITTTDNTITVYNPASVDVWIKVGSNAYAIHPGETKTYIYNPGSDFAVEKPDYTPTSYDIAIDNNMSVSGSNTIGETGLVTLVKASTTTLVQPNGSNYQQFQIKQTALNKYSDYLLLGSSASPSNFSMQKLTVIDMKYKIKLDNYTSALKPSGQFKFNVSTGFNDIIGDKATASAYDQDTWRTLKIIIDPLQQRIYYSQNGDSLYGKPFKTAITSVKDIKLLLQALPGTTDTTVTALESPITWTFDYIKAYQVSPDELFMIDNLICNKDINDASKINYKIDVKNYDDKRRDGAIITALYDNSGDRPMLIDMKSKAITQLYNNATVSAEGTFDVSILQDKSYIVKTYLWNGLDEMIPYDDKTINSSEL